MLANATISRDDMAWREGMPEWRPLRTFFSPPPPPGMPPVPQPLAPKFISRLNTVYRTSKIMLPACALSILMPFILMLLAPLGILYFFWRKSLLAEVDAKGLMLPPAQRAEVDYVRANKQELLLPLYFLIGFALFIAGIIVFLPKP
jgi:hypothetical protein